MFWVKNKKIVYPCIHHFHYIKLGFKGYTLHGHDFLANALNSRKAKTKDEFIANQFQVIYKTITTERCFVVSVQKDLLINKAE